MSFYGFMSCYRYSIEKIEKKVESKEKIDVKCKVMYCLGSFLKLYII